MTKERLLFILETIMKKIGIKDFDVFYRYLEVMSEDEIKRWGVAVESEQGEFGEAFIEALKNYLLIRAKPWAAQNKQ